MEFQNLYNQNSNLYDNNVNKKESNGILIINFRGRK